jgi:hypothetical protein
MQQNGQSAHSRTISLQGYAPLTLIFCSDSGTVSYHRWRILSISCVHHRPTQRYLHTTHSSGPSTTTGTHSCLQGPRSSCTKSRISAAAGIHTEKLDDTLGQHLNTTGVTNATSTTLTVNGSQTRVNYFHLHQRSQNCRCMKPLSSQLKHSPKHSSANNRHPT